MSTQEDLAALLPKDTNTNHLEFMMMLIEGAVGGLPVLGYNRDVGWVMVSTCNCDACKGFTKDYKPVPSPTIVGAAYNYSLERSAFNEKHAKSKDKDTLH